MGNPYLSIVVPCYNEEAGLAELHRRLTAVCRPLGRSYELVLVNDGSSDGTWEHMRELCANDPHIVAVDLSRNHGHELALAAGLNVCRGERVLIMDADLQDPPELLPDMMAIMDRGADVVYGKRRHRTGETRLKLWTAAAFYRVMERLTEVAIPRDTGNFRLMSRRVVRVLAELPERYRFVRGMISWVGYRQEAILYDREPRFAGATNYNYRKMIRLSADAITAFSIRPLNFAVTLSVGVGAIAVLLLAYSLIAAVAGGPYAGWTGLAGIMMFLGSLQFLVLGIIGQYVGRTYDQSKGRPLFILREVLSNPDEIADFDREEAVGESAPLVSGQRSR